MNTGCDQLSLVESIRLKMTADMTFDLIARGKIFELTGSKEIEFDFEESASFNLGFGERGSISGFFKRISRPNFIELTWDVKGFGRPDERSNVLFKIRSVSQNDTELEVHHRAILSDQSRQAKTSAWKEILSSLAVPTEGEFKQ